MEAGADKIAQLKELTGLMTAREVFQETAEQRRRFVAGEFEIERIVAGEVVKNDSGEFFLVTRTFPITELQGNTSLSAAQQVGGEAIAVISNDEQLREFRLDRAVFLDTETTGLSGGTGTYAFLVGVGRFEGGNFVLRQYFMRDYDEEEPMLLPLADLFHDADGVVTYNGKAFDIPLLQTRFVTSRIRIDLEELPHLDLLHVARRLWRARLRDCSLSNVEREVLGVVRQGDIPSYLIPQVYFNYVRSRDARRLRAVFYHNEQDILSLAGLASHASRVATSPPECIEAHPLDLLSLARLHFRQRRFRRSERHASDAYDLGLEPDAARNALYLLALSLKRQRRWQDAHAVWCQLAAHCADDIAPRVEMAKHLEHRERDLEKARIVCEQALEVASNLEIGKARIEQLQYRLARIERKLVQRRLTEK
jgi:uncharacterized protein YprB with RNaseH-like and TPR domain